MTRSPSIGTLLALVSLLFATALVLLCSAASAAAPVKRPCSFMYINGDLVVSCPKASR